MKRRFIIYDRNVESFAAKVAAQTSAESSFAIVADEPHKILSTVEDICRWLLEKEADRHCELVAVGGGVTTDMVGFAASIYKRGVTYFNVPTTLLAQVDAAIGGKTAVNLDGVKNTLGTFWMPEHTDISLEPLKTLPREEMLSGLAELLKTFLLVDAKNYERAVKLFSEPELDLDNPELLKLIKRAGDIKRAVTRRDPREHGLRKILNLGHTYGHAISWYQAGSEHPYSHGETVAIGTIKAAELSEKMGYAKSGLADKLRADFTACGLPTELPCAEEALKPAIRNDKKMKDGLVSFVFPVKVGKVIYKSVSVEEI